ncbi:MAG: N-formylglutamate amidohydrolase [Candidatus Gracilibacteria bacterium]
MISILSLKFVPKELHNMSSTELLSYYDNPRNFKIKDPRNKEWDNSDYSFPSNCLVFLTHGSYAVNEKIRRTTELTKTAFLRLIRNYSDFGTRKMVKKSGIPDKNVICFPGSRAIGDPNREYKTQKEDDKLEQGKKFIRDSDFNSQVIIKNPGQFRKIGKSKIGKYHKDLENSLSSAERNTGGSIGFDIHDTGTNLMNKENDFDTFREEGFPEITLGTKEGESCNSEILEFFAKKLKLYLGLKIFINEPFKGGFVTTKHGQKNRQEENKGNGLKKSKRNLIQVEIGRYLYMKESTQEIDWERMEILGEGIKRAITDTGIKFGEEYFKSI